MCFIEGETRSPFRFLVKFLSTGKQVRKYEQRVTLVARSLCSCL